MEVLLILTASGQEVEKLIPLGDVPALLAALERSSLTLEDILAQVFFTLRALQASLESIEHSLDVLSGVFLRPDINRLHALLLVFIREHEVLGVVVLSVGQLKGGEEALELMD